MNNRWRHSLKSLSSCVSITLGNTVNSIISLFRMMILSKYSIARKSRRYPELRNTEDCIILANGPSLKKAFENGDVRCDGKDVFVVNMFSLSNEFWSIKPRFYCIIDHGFFAPKNDRVKNLISQLTDALNRVDWCMYLFISSGATNGGIITGLHNENIKIIKWNTSTFEGFKGICHFLYRHNMAMPRCQTVTNMALMTAINLNYKNIYLYGADHSWTLDLRVNDNNEVCYGDRHVYATNLNVVKKDCTIGHLLNQFSKMFDSHWEINDYAIYKNSVIWNCTKSSFIDAYPRLFTNNTKS